MDDASLSVVLQRQEELLLAREVRSSAGRLRELLADDFVEFGSSGRVFHLAEIVHLLAQEDSRQASAAHLSEFTLVRLGREAALVTYRLQRGGSISLRSSVWVECSGQWCMRFHQGTRAA